MQALELNLAHGRYKVISAVVIYKAFPSSQQSCAIAMAVRPRLQTGTLGLRAEQPGAGSDLGSPVSAPQEQAMTRSRTRKGERAQRSWRSTSFQTWTTRTQTRTWTKMRMRTRRRARTSHQDRPRRHPRPARQPRCRQTPHLFRAPSPQMPPLATRPPGAAQSQKPSAWQPAAAPCPAKASCASPGWDRPHRAPWRRTQARP